MSSRPRADPYDDGARAPVASCGGVTDVAAYYTRQGRNGPVQVAAHQRSVPCG
jgi:hypothetical protein